MDKIRQREIQEVKQYQKELALEKEAKLEKKKKEREAAWKVIKENEVKEKIKQQQKKDDKLHA